MTLLPTMQMSLRPGCVEFGWGHPAMDLLPAGGLRQAAMRTLERPSPQALVYGAAQGPGRLLELIQQRLARIDGRATPVDQLLVTGGVSQALDMICTHCAQPGDIALVESPVYHFGLRLLRDRGLELRPVATDADGLRVDALAEALEQARHEGRRATLLYTVPTFSNPTGRSLTAERRANLVNVAVRHDLIVLEDDVYRELWFDVPPPPSLMSYGAANIVRLGSFSKILAPGLRLGWLSANAALVQRIAGSGLLTSGGGINHMMANIVADYIEPGVLDDHVVQLRTAYRQRRDTLISALARYLPSTCRFDNPGGGFFVWVELPEGVNSAVLLPRAEAAGVAYLPGERFFTDGSGQHNLRLAFSLLSDAEMRTGAARLGELLHAVASET